MSRGRRDSGIFSAAEGDPDEEQWVYTYDENREESDDDERKPGPRYIHAQSSEFESPESCTPPRSSTPPAKWSNMSTGRFYRSISLRSALKSGTSPRNRKAVRFADVMGLDLEHTRNIIQNDTLVYRKSSAAPDERMGSCADSKPVSTASSSGGKFLMPYFTLPTGYNTEKLLRSQQVCLESLMVSDLSVTGVVRVMNLAFHKLVHIRYSLDDWKSWSEIRACYIPGSNDEFTDKFVFNLFLPQALAVFTFCQFAIRYNVGSWEYWDNYHNKNYILECCEQRRLATFSPSLDYGWMHF